MKEHEKSYTKRLVSYYFHSTWIAAGKVMAQIVPVLFIQLKWLASLHRGFKVFNEQLPSMRYVRKCLWSYTHECNVRTCAKLKFKFQLSTALM